MAQNIQKTDLQMDDLMKRSFLRLSHKQNGAQQYRSISNPNHTQNGIDSPQVVFSTLKNVQSYHSVNTAVLTSAQVLTLNSAPFIIVKAPPARCVNIVHNITCRLSYGGTAYTGTHNLEFHYTNGAGTQVTDPVPASFINATASAFYHAPAVAASFAPIEGGTGGNGQIVAFVNTANPAVGNSTLTIVVHYHVVSFAR